MKRVLVFSAFLICCTSAYSEWTTPVPLIAVNASGQVSGPHLSSDGLTLYFAVSKQGGPFQLYQASRDNLFDDFVNVNRINELSSYANTIYPCISKDGLRLYYGRLNRFYMSTRISQDSSWSNGQPVPGLNGLGDVEYLRLSADELNAVFGSYAIAGGRGSYDLYVANRPDRNSPFTNIRNVSEINTSGNDGGPWLSDDGLTLYYHTNISGKFLVYQTSRPTVTSQFGPSELVPVAPGYGQPCPFDGGIVLARDWKFYVSHLNTAPVAEAGDDQTVYAGLDHTAAVTLDGSKSSDSQKDQLDYLWSYTINGQIYEANGVKPQIVLPSGTHKISLVVSDGEFDSEADDVNVTVVGPLKVLVKLSPVLNSRQLITARLAFPLNLKEQIDPYSVTFAAAPEVKPSYFNLTVAESSIQYNAIFRDVPGQLIKPNVPTKVFGSFRSGRLFYGEDKIKTVNTLKK